MYLFHTQNILFLWTFKKHFKIYLTVSRQGTGTIITTTAITLFIPTPFQAPDITSAHGIHSTLVSKVWWAHFTGGSKFREINWLAPSGRARIVLKSMHPKACAPSYRTPLRLCLFSWGFEISLVLVTQSSETASCVHPGLNTDSYREVSLVSRTSTLQWQHPEGMLKAATLMGLVTQSPWHSSGT